MSNEEYLKLMQVKYENAKYFRIENNILILNYHKIYKLSLNSTKLNRINENIFFLNPLEIFQIIYMLELIHKPNLNENENKYIVDYTKHYLNINDKSFNNTEEKAMEIWCLSIPIYTSYDPECENTPGSILVHNIIDNQTKEQLNNSNHDGKKLVLQNSNSPNYNENEESTNNFGFITALLIIGVVIIAVSYITWFFINANI